MASFRALTVQSGEHNQQQDADTLIVGAGIDAAANLSIGAGTATALILGRAGAGTSVGGGLTLSAGSNLTVDSGTVAAALGAATLNKQSGVVTSEALTTIGGQTYTLTLTNSVVTAGSRVFCSLDNGTNTTGPIYVSRVTPGAGSVVIVVTNGAAAIALNGTIKIAFFVVL